MSWPLPADLRQLSQQITVERELFKTRINDTFEPLRNLFSMHCEVCWVHERTTCGVTVCVM